MKKLTVAVGWASGWVGGRGKVTLEMLLVIYRKDRTSAIKHFGNEFG